MTFSWGALGAVVVGLVFVSTGFAKAADPRLFADHVQRLGIGPIALVNGLTGATILFECGWGAALVLGVRPSIVYPATLGVLGVLTSITFWSTRSGRTNDCGCYTGLVEVTPRRSVALNGGYAVLVGTAWALHSPTVPLSRPALLAVGGTALAGGLLAAVVHGYRLRYGTPLIDRSPLRPGRTWANDWLGTTPVSRRGDELVVFLAPGCSACARWLRVLRTVHRRAEMPRVVGLILGGSDEAADYAAEAGLNFPTAAVMPEAARRIIRQTPTAVRLGDGVIREKWEGTMPASFVQRLRETEAVGAAS